MKLYNIEKGIIEDKQSINFGDTNYKVSRIFNNVKLLRKLGYLNINESNVKVNTKYETYEKSYEFSIDNDNVIVLSDEVNYVLFENKIQLTQVGVDFINSENELPIFTFILNGVESEDINVNEYVNNFITSPLDLENYDGSIVKNEVEVNFEVYKILLTDLSNLDVCTIVYTKIDRLLSEVKTELINSLEMYVNSKFLNITKKYEAPEMIMWPTLEAEAIKYLISGDISDIPNIEVEADMFGISYTDFCNTVISDSVNYRAVRPLLTSTRNSLTIGINTCTTLSELKQFEIDSNLLTW